jgi:hypothetical protein
MITDNFVHQKTADRFLRLPTVLTLFNACSAGAA